jgi:hypothetical protein
MKYFRQHRRIDWAQEGKKTMFSVGAVYEGVNQLANSIEYVAGNAPL